MYMCCKVYNSYGKLVKINVLIDALIQILFAYIVINLHPIHSVSLSTGLHNSFNLMYAHNSIAF